MREGTGTEVREGTMEEKEGSGTEAREGSGLRPDVGLDRNLDGGLDELGVQVGMVRRREGKEVQDEMEDCLLEAIEDAFLGKPTDLKFAKGKVVG